MYKAVKNYEQIQSKKAILKDERSQQIMQKARNFGVEVFENEVLASELFDLALVDDFDKELFEDFMDIFEVCEKAIQRAQMSS